MLGHEQAIKILLQNSRCLQAIDVEEADQRTALHIAAFSGHLACVKLLLEQGANVESRDFYGMSPLHLASSQGHADCIGQLLSVGADANSVDNMGQTSVHVAVQGNRVACVGALLQNGALCDVRDVWHTTALQYAVSGERHECVEVLVRYGADPSLTVNGLHVMLLFEIMSNCIAVCVGS
jgi:serine/threonine-protein phosphatase 6 regulatory ankyrin repeat subunit A